MTDLWFDEENGKYMSDPTRAYVDDRYQSILDDLENSEDGYYLVVELKNGGVSIGSTGIFPTGDDTYDIGYCVHKSKWQQGFGTEIVALLLEWLRNHGAHKVMAEVAIANLPSNLLLQKFGFAVEKTSTFQKYNSKVVGIKPPSPKRFGGSLLPILSESNFRNKKSMVQYPRIYQQENCPIEKEQNKSLIGIKGVARYGRN